MKRFIKRIMGVASAALLLLAIPLTMCLAMDASDAPDTVEIDTLVNYFEKVEFPHELHVDITEGDCAACHHHTTGTPVTDPNCIRCHANSGEQDLVACKDCHPTERFSRDYITSLEKPLLYHINKPGLKGIYHLNCRNCHVEMDGPVGCEDCHTMTDEGQKLYRTGKYMPQGHGKKHH